MKKAAQPTYYAGMTPGVEPPPATNKAGWPDWALPAGAIAGGLLGYGLLRRLGGRAAKGLHGKAPAAAAPTATKPVDQVAQMARLEAAAAENPMLRSELYPGTPIGVRSGELYEGVRNSKDWNQIRRELARMARGK